MTTKREAATHRINEALERLTASLSQGRSTELLEYLRCASRFHRYSFRNLLLIASQRPGATHVAGYRAWKRFGRHVKKGERGILIIAPAPIKRRDSEDEESTEMRFRAAYVFDVSQTEGEALPEPPTFIGDPRGYLERLHSFAERKAIAVEQAEHLFPPGTQGLSHGGRIQLLSSLSPAEEFDVLAHELAHELLHQRSSEGRPSKTIRETEAQAVACVVSDAVGLDGMTASADYILGYDGTTETVAASLDRIQRVSHEILGAIAPEFKR